MPTDPVAALALLALSVFVLAGLCLCYAIGADAAARGASGLGWGLFAFVLLPIAVPAYLLYRTRLPDRGEIDRRERWLGAFGIGGATASAVASVLSPPDPFTWLVIAVPSLVVFVPAAAVLCYSAGWRVALDS